MQIEGSTAAGFVYSCSGGDGPVVVLLHPHPLSLPALTTMIAGFLTELDLHHVTLVCNDPHSHSAPCPSGGFPRTSSGVGSIRCATTPRSAATSTSISPTSPSPSSCSSGPTSSDGRRSGSRCAPLDKDRDADTGGHSGEPIATIRGTWRGGASALTIDPPDDDDPANNNLNRRLLVAIAEAGEAGLLGTRGIRDAVGGKGRHADLATERLVVAGVVDEAPHGCGYVYLITDAGSDALAGINSEAEPFHY